MPRLSQVVSQTIRSLNPEALTERFFGDRLEGWWQEYARLLKESAYQGGNVQSAFFIATFSAMGRMAKVDGRIHESEINLASRVMDHLKLDATQRRLAIRLFNDGKQSDFNLDVVLSRFYRHCQHRVSVLQIFIEIQLQTAFSDGATNDKEKALLKRMCKRLDVSESIFNRIVRRVRKNNFTGEAMPQVKPAKAMSLSKAYSLLEVSRWASKDDVKKAYRRLLSQHHPDKIIAKGATEDELEDATYLIQDIKRAYEIVSRSKKIR